MAVALSARSVSFPSLRLSEANSDQHAHLPSGRRSGVTCALLWRFLAGYLPVESDMCHRFHLAHVLMREPVRCDNWFNGFEVPHRVGPRNPKVTLQMDSHLVIAKAIMFPFLWPVFNNYLYH